uniref:fused response regulator/phosphatase n=1 Tax=Ningiella ruwaisensis TaxID=2364274 RepID=UPI00109F58CD|nr:fused response regulator/phosphatase [Ningiella ruwaisensis]
MRVLIIEDDSLFAEILQTFLEDNNCTTLVADSIASAKLHLQSSIFQFALLDNHLPDGSGIHFIDFLKNELPHDKPLPVMMITADENQNLMLEAFEKGADDFLVKPLSLDLLWQKMQRVNSLYQKEAQLAEQAQHLSSLLNKQEHEEQLARYVYEHVASTLNTETECVDTYIQSSSSFNGDVFICDTAPNGNRFVILADATGHGLAAAISILPLVATIKAMIRKGLSLAHIVHEANKKLCIELPDDKFVTLIGVEINFSKQKLDLFNGGMPDIIAIKHDKTLERFASSSMALGILEPEDFDPGIVSMQTHSVSNLFFFSDGLIEQQNPFKEEFGMARVLDVLEKNTGKEGLLSQVVNHFTVFNEMEELQDDLSICDLQIAALMDAHLYQKKQTTLSNTGKLCASIQLEGGLIGTSDIVGCFDSLMRCADVVGDMRQRAFTVFAELISNALDHGILGLDSKLKNDYAGFAEYLMLKEERLASIDENERLEMHFEFNPKTSEIAFSIKDSGKGYEVKGTGEMDDDSLSGRGLSLIDQLCKSVEVTPPGNQTSVVIKREF